MCFTLGWVENLVIWGIVLTAVILVFQLLIPWLWGILGLPVFPGPWVQILKIIIACAILIFICYVVFDLIQCLGHGGGRLGY